MEPQPVFKILKDEKGRYYWGLQTANDRVIAWSGHTYESKQWCLQDLGWVKERAYMVEVFDYTGEYQ